MTKPAKKKVFEGWVDTINDFKWDNQEEKSQSLLSPDVYKVHDPMLKEKKIRITVEEL